MTSFVQKLLNVGDYIFPSKIRVRKHKEMLESDETYRDFWLTMIRQHGYHKQDTSLSERGYDAVNTANWNDDIRSADNILLTDLRLLRLRSRELVRNDPVASGIVNTVTQNVIGIGIEPQARTGDADLDQIIEDVFTEIKDEIYLGEEISYVEAQELVFRKALEDGDIIAKESYTKGIDHLWFELIEADRCDLISTGRAGNTVNHGVERDDQGFITKFHVRKKQFYDDYLEIPAERCIFLRRVLRPGQTRGLPYLTPVIQDIRDLDLLITAELKKEQIQACLSAFVKTEVKTTQLFDVTAQKYGYILNQKLEPGMIMRLYPGESIESVVPHSGGAGFEPFVISLARRIGTSLGLCWSSVLRDFSGSNYSSARTDLLNDRITFRSFQRWFTVAYLAKERFRVLRDLRDLRGEPRLRNVTDQQLKAVYWRPPGWDWVDPQKEANATALRLQIGLSTLRDELASRGLDWEEVLEQIAKEQAVKDQLGILQSAVGEDEESDKEPEDGKKPKPKNNSTKKTNGRIAKILEGRF